MAETGHAINIANYKKIHDMAVGFGVKWSPMNIRLLVAAILADWTAADGAQTAMNAAIIGAKQPQNNREAGFEPLNPIVTRALAGASSLDISDQMKADLKGFADEIRGQNRNTAEPPAEGAPPDEEEEFMSTSHLSYVNRLNNFDLFRKALKAIPEYVPVEADITTTALDTLYTSLKALNDAVEPFVVAASNGRILRNHKLYDAKVGIFDTQKLAKQYCESVFGGKSPEFKLMSSLHFTDNH